MSRDCETGKYYFNVTFYDTEAGITVSFQVVVEL
jgi:hypothetical protein